MSEKTEKQKSGAEAKDDKKKKKGTDKDDASHPSGKQPGFFEKPWLAVLGVLGPGLLVIVGGFAVAYQNADPPVPTGLAIVAGPEDSEQLAYAKRYAEILEKDGITLEVRATSGSRENLALLEAGKDDVFVGMVLTGTAPESRPGKLETIASLYLEPMWVFHRGMAPITLLSTLRGARVAIGNDGTDTAIVANQLLAEAGVLYTAPSLTSQTQITRLLPLEGFNAANALRVGDIDAMVMVAPPLSPMALSLLRIPGIQVMQLLRADAYHRRHPYLASATLPQGALDITTDVPDREVAMIAPAMTLLMREDLHPALIPLFVKAVKDVHSLGDMLSEAGTFPNMRYREFPMNVHAERYFNEGLSPLYRLFSFKTASSIERFRFLLLPLFFLALPALWVLPYLWRWRLRKRVYRWYRVLRTIDQKVSGEVGKELLEKERNTLEAMEQELNAVAVPMSYMDKFYTLRQHIRLLKLQVEAKLEGGDRRR